MVKQKLILFILAIFVFVQIAMPIAVLADVTPTVAPSDTPTTTSAPTNSPTSTPSDTPTTTPSTTPTPTPSGSPSVSPTPTDTISPTPTIDPNASVTPTPTVDPNASITPSPTPGDPSLVATNSAGVTNDATNTAVSGSNSTNSPGSAAGLTPPAGGSGPSINTGTAASVSSTDNNVNATSVNSQFVNQTVNIFLAQNANLDLSNPFTVVSDAVAKDSGNSPVINLLVFDNHNYARLDNNINTSAVTGQNQMQNATNGNITTGNAVADTSLLNKVNFTIANSKVHLVTINIFGTLNGNIILPEYNTSSACNGCGVSVAANNNAQVNNTVGSNAVSGQNNATANGTAGITTGNAQSSSNILNMINTTFFGVTFENLFVNVLGVWNGSFLGWDLTGSANGGGNLSLTGNNGGVQCAGCPMNVNADNQAVVNNNIQSNAISGQNDLTALGNGSIHTGNAYSMASIFNFINSNIINSVGSFVFVNVFGTWNGNIGGKSKFAKKTQTNADIVLANAGVDSSQNGSADSQVLEDGGKLEVNQRNNVGAYVLPGDTITFFVDIKNPGSGKVYGTKAAIHLIKDGVDAGGAAFNIGDIPGGKTAKLSTGLVLSKTVEAGVYTARVFALGTTGSKLASIEATGDSTFTVFVPGGSNLLTGTQGTTITGTPKVLGLSTTKLHIASKKAHDDHLMLLLMIVVSTYVGLKTIRNYRKIKETLASEKFQQRIQAVRMFVL